VLHHEDLEIVRALIKGDSQRFDDLFDELFPRLYRFVLLRVHGEVELAREVCQQALVRAMENLTRYRGEAALFTWICQIARHVLSDSRELQSRDRERLVAFDEDVELRAAIDSLGAPDLQRPDKRGADAELSHLVLMALDYLPPHYSRVLELKYVDGLSVQDMSRRLGRPFPATQSLLWRARADFREVFTRLAGAEVAALLHD
jgi:RNA polymerase sigma-70 factor (ECF subfamily)